VAVVTVLRGNGGFSPRETAVSGLAVLLALNVVAPDAVVARFDVERATSLPSDAVVSLDRAHLAGLSGEAIEYAVHAVLEPPRPTTSDAIRLKEADDRCRAASLLLARWGPSSKVQGERDDDASWRSWNAGEVRALAEVGRHSVGIRTPCISPARKCPRHGTGP